MKERVGLILPMASEAEVLVERLNLSSTTSLGGLSVYSFEIGDRLVHLTVSGVGTDITGYAVGELRSSVDSFLLFGVAGGLMRPVKPGSGIVANSVFHHDLDLGDFGENQILGVYKADPDILRGIEDASSQAGVDHVVGLLATGNQFIRTEDEVERIRAIAPDGQDPIAVDMEGAALARCADATGKPFGIFRVISDGAGEAGPSAYESNLNHASMKISEVLLAYLES